MLTVTSSQGTAVSSQIQITRDQSEVRYRDLLRDGDIDQIRKEFPKYFKGEPAIGFDFYVERVTRRDLQARMVGLCLDVEC